MTDDLTLKLHSTTDARVWADEFCKLFVVSRHPAQPGEQLEGFDDEVGLITSWFANAIEVGRNAGLTGERQQVYAVDYEQPIVHDDDAC